MSYAITGAASALPNLPSLLTRSIVPQLQTLSIPAKRSYAPCCFSSPYYSSSDATNRKQFTSLCANESSEQQRKPYAQRQTQQRPRAQHPQYSTKSASPNLETPHVIFSNNHLLVVNKPAGWKSQPGDGAGKKSMQNGAGSVDPKCLLTHLQSESLGGGSMKNFLNPTHRLDQPCTGALIFAKNGKAASRVQVAWAKRNVKKCYWVVVEGGTAGTERDGKMDGLELLRNRSMPVSGRNKRGKSNIFQLSAILKSTKGKGGYTKGGRSSKNAGGSVTAKPLPPNYSSKDTANNNDGSVYNDGRVCHIEWEHLLILPAKTPSTSTRHLLSVTTDTGAKHQVRALLALAGGAPIAGDLRYGNSYNKESEHQQGRVDKPLPDGSVALHARTIFLPTVSLGGMDFLKDKPFVASIPKRWREFFGICEDDVKAL